MTVYLSRRGVLGGGLAVACACGAAAQPQSGGRRPFCTFQPPSGGFLTTLGVVPKSYGLKGAGRGSPILTWSFSGAVKGVKTPTNQIAQAFNAWAAAAPALQFTQVNSGADITIGVGALGAVQGGVALGSTSSDGRSITFSNSVTFVSSGGNPDFLNVATHEIGHALGLLHATTPASIMYPFTSTQEALQADDIAAISALYSWSGQRKLQGGTEQAPAISACGKTLAMAWRGSGNDHSIWIALSADGEHWTPQKRISDTGTIGGPSLAWDGVYLWLAWRGAEDDNLYWAFSADLFQRTSGGTHKIESSGSSHGPRITAINGAPMMVWKGVNDDTGIYLSTYSLNRWSNQIKLPGVNTASAPAICAEARGGGRLAWRGAGNDQTLWTAALSNTTLVAPARVTWTVLVNGSSAGAPGSPRSAAGPGLTLARSRIIMTWRGADDDQRLWFTQLAFDTLPNNRTAEQWSSEARIPDTGSSVGISAAEFNGVLYAVWKGVEDDTGIYSASL
jgi:hypothetical protein